MIPVNITQSGTGAMRWINPNRHMTPFAVAISVELSGTTPAAQLEITNDAFWQPGVTPTAIVSQGNTLSAAGTALWNLTGPALRPRDRMPSDPYPQAPASGKSRGSRQSR
jgi:hypothetical protein